MLERLKNLLDVCATSEKPHDLLEGIRLEVVRLRSIVRPGLAITDVDREVLEEILDKLILK